MKWNKTGGKGMQDIGERSDLQGIWLAASQMFTAAYTPLMTQNMYIHWSTKSLAAQWLRLHPLNAVSPDLISGQRTRSHMPQ